LRFFKPSAPLRFVFHFTLQKSSFPGKESPISAISRQQHPYFGNSPVTSPRFRQSSGNKHPVFGNVPATTGNNIREEGIFAVRNT
jgi:hypothetical protein